VIREYFNEQANNWDARALERDPSKLEQMAAHLDLKLDNLVLDIGTGTGVFLPYILKKVGDKGQVIGLDIAEKMLLQAQVKNIKGHVNLICGDVQYIPLKEGTCDGAVCYSSFPHFQDKLKALSEIRRVLKEGGKLYVCHTSGRNEINRIHTNIPSFQNHLLPDRTAMTQLLLAAGFTGIKVEDEDESYFASGWRPYSG
jgi:ubiquinone/menaquinone biosynthesis C-methylase UbiE